jgi:hypothetical protein
MPFLWARVIQLVQKIGRGGPFGVVVFTDHLGTPDGPPRKKDGASKSLEAVERIFSPVRLKGILEDRRIPRPIGNCKDQFLHFYSRFSSTNSASATVGTAA